MAVEYRRPPGLVCYWKRDQLFAFNPRSVRHVAMTADLLPLLDVLDTWTSADAFAARIESTSTDASGNLLEALADLSLIERSTTERSDDLWAPWEPEAAFFHFATRDLRYPEDRRLAATALEEKARTDPPPKPTKRVDGPRHALPRGPALGHLEETLKARRTWRQFSSAPVAKESLGTLLDLTCRVQKWADTENQGRIGLKTSPSAGARHPIETYVLAWNVDGVRPGAYHYDAADGALVDLGRPINGEQAAALIAHQHYYAGASALLVFTAVFERELWKYPFSRAYRAVLIDAGHLAQTCCLVATELGLAPFCTMAFFETPIETLLGIDGRRESALYVAGVGSRPAGQVNQSRIPEDIRYAD